MADTAKEIAERLRTRSKLHRDWDKWELGDKPVPEATNFAETADELAEAATLIEQLVAERDGQAQSAADTGKLVAEAFSEVIEEEVRAEREACAAIAVEHDRASGESIAHMIRARSTHA